jgi:hypothetical protein
MSAKRTGQVYAQLPAAADIDMLENGQFVKYNYAKGVCDFDAEVTSGPWMMVYNEVKVYEDRETDADFAMLRENYSAYVYSPVGQSSSDVISNGTYGSREGSNVAYTRDVEKFTYGVPMPNGTKMTPRVVKIEIGDLFTTNTIMAEAGSLKVGDTLKIGEDGYLAAGKGAGGDADPIFVVVKVYTMPDLQPGVKLQRVA